MKITSSDLLAILRRFGEAGDEHVPRHIDQIKQSHPSPINQLVQFRFNRHHYFVLIDETAEDRVGYIMQQIFVAKSDAAGEILQNPTSDLTTYGLPFKGKDIYLFRQHDGKKRLDVILAERYPDTSRSTWQKHIRAGHISVNGQVVESPRSEISDTDNIAIDLPAGTDYSAHELPIIHLDDSVIAIDKPIGVLTHSKGALNDEFTVAEFMRRYTSVGLDTNRPGIVHRLDRDTSGVMIGARTPEAFELLKSQFADRRAHKTYYAVVVGHPRLDSALIDLPIGRHPSAPSTFRVDAKGKSACTSYEVLARTDKYSLLRLQPTTGRTHQLRVHLAHLGTPILGDRIYGKAADRLYLHAAALEITIPVGDRRTFTAPLPAAFTTLFPGVAIDADA